jgi:hypothetical protein
MSGGPRPREQRRQDAELRLATDVDVWVATASPEAGPYLVPLSFHWDGATLLLATPAASPTGRNPRQPRSSVSDWGRRGTSS